MMLGTLLRSLHVLEVEYKSEDTSTKGNKSFVQWKTSE